ncbi:MAG TPA: electron transport complex subunit RsxC [Wenzhouxiangella sp.]
MSVTLHNFFGGLALEHHKTKPMDRPVQCLPAPPMLYLPLKGHRHQPFDPHQINQYLAIVIGQRVVAGQALTRFADDAQPELHAPLAGTFVGVVAQPATKGMGQDVMCLQLAADADAPPKPLPSDHGPDTALPDLSTDEFLDQLQALGLVGLGGAQFPTSEKMRQGKGTIHTLILNGVECEPYIACDEALMRHRPAAILLGGRLLAKALGAKRLIVAYEDPLKATHGSVEDGFRACLEPHPIDPMLEIELVQVPAIYPQGAERQLIKTLTHQEVPFDGLPKDIGVMCSNVATAANVADAIIDHTPLIHRLVTVTGTGVRTPCNVYAPIGTPVSHLIQQAGGYTQPESDIQLIIGGPVSGHGLLDDRAPIDKGTLCVLALTKQKAPESSDAMPCINCGFCVSVCPSQLLPQTLFKFASQGAHEKAQQIGIMDCIECGLCGEVCPSHLPLLDWYRHSKDQLRALDLDQRRQALAKQRFEARTQRLEKRQAEREARRQERRARLEASPTAKSDIEAAIARAREKKAPKS